LIDNETISTVGRVARAVTIDRVQDFWEWTGEAVACTAGWVEGTSIKAEIWIRALASTVIAENLASRASWKRRAITDTSIIRGNNVLTTSNANVGASNGNTSKQVTITLSIFLGDETRIGIRC
jgi:hypothetical protein